MTAALHSLLGDQLRQGERAAHVRADSAQRIDPPTIAAHQQALQELLSLERMQPQAEKILDRTHLKPRRATLAWRGLCRSLTGRGIELGGIRFFRSISAVSVGRHGIAGGGLLVRAGIEDFAVGSSIGSPSRARRTRGSIRAVCGCLRGVRSRGRAGCPPEQATTQAPGKGCQQRASRMHASHHANSMPDDSHLAGRHCSVGRHAGCNRCGHTSTWGLTTLSYPSRVWLGSALPCDG